MDHSGPTPVRSENASIYDELVQEHGDVLTLAREAAEAAHRRVDDVFAGRAPQQDQAVGAVGAPEVVEGTEGAGKGGKAEEPGQAQEAAGSAGQERDAA